MNQCKKIEKKVKPDTHIPQPTFLFVSLLICALHAKTHTTQHTKMNNDKDDDVVYGDDIESASSFSSSLKNAQQGDEYDKDIDDIIDEEEDITINIDAAKKKSGIKAPPSSPITFPHSSSSATHHSVQQISNAELSRQLQKTFAAWHRTSTVAKIARAATTTSKRTTTATTSSTTTTTRRKKKTTMTTTTTTRRTYSCLRPKKHLA